MRNLLILAMLAAMSLATSEAQAAGRRTQTTSTNGNTTGNGYTAQRNNRPFGRLMELERRKNAALRQMFLGR